jgi:hypothetical protein
MASNTRVEVQHRWFEYGRWFYGYGSSMDLHRHDDPGVRCEWREVTVTTDTEAGDWSSEKPDRG